MSQHDHQPMHHHQRQQPQARAAAAAGAASLRAGVMRFSGASQRVALSRPSLSLAATRHVLIQPSSSSPSSPAAATDKRRAVAASVARRQPTECTVMSQLSCSTLSPRTERGDALKLDATPRVSVAGADRSRAERSWVPLCAAAAVEVSQVRRTWRRLVA